MNIKAAKVFVVALLIVLLTGLSASQITGHAIRNDALWNLRFAFNYSHHGVLSADVKPPYLPSNSREPVPNLVTAYHLRFLGLNQASFSDLKEGPGAKMVKLGNLYWVALGLTATALLVNELTSSFALVVLCMALSGYFFFASPFFVDTLYTELQAAVFLLWASFFLLKALSSGKKLYFFLAGLCLGLLSLTKALFFYITIALVAFLIVQWLFLMVCLKKATALRSTSIILAVAGFIITASPWILRNKIELGTMQVAQRGGRVIYARAIKNNMEYQEIPGAIYFWGPSFYQHASRILGSGAQDKDFQKGGRYQRINREGSDFQAADLLAEGSGRPEAAISYYRKTRAEINKIQIYAKTMGIADPARYAEDAASKRAKSMILSNPARHLVMTPLFMWRGIWAWPNQGVRIIKSNGYYVIFKDVLGLMAYFSLFAIFALGLLRGNSRYLAITILPVAMLLAYGLLTHNLPRYSAPAIPLMIISMAVVFKHFSPATGIIDVRKKKQ